MEPFKDHFQSFQSYTAPSNHQPDARFVHPTPQTHQYMVPVYKVAGYTTPSRIPPQPILQRPSPYTSQHSQSRPTAIVPHTKRLPAPGVDISTAFVGVRPRSAVSPYQRQPHTRQLARHSPPRQPTRQPPVTQSPHHPTSLEARQSHDIFHVMNDMAVLKRQVHNLTERGNDFARELARLRGENEQMHWEAFRRPGVAEGGLEKEGTAKVETHVAKGEREKEGTLNVESAAAVSVNTGADKEGLGSGLRNWVRASV